jgi:hypothetical protein
MHDAKDHNSIVLYQIHNAIPSEDHFPKVISVELGNDSADASILEERFSRFDDSIDEGNRMEGGITGNEVFDVLKIVPGGQRPADLRHRAILSFNSSWVRTRPSATS